MTTFKKDYDIIGRKGGTFNGYVIKPLLDEKTGKSSNNGRITVDSEEAAKHIEKQPYFNKTVKPSNSEQILFKNASSNNQISPKVGLRPVIINPLGFNPDELTLVDHAIDNDPGCVRLMRENVLAIAKDRLEMSKEDKAGEKEANVLGSSDGSPAPKEPKQKAADKEPKVKAADKTAKEPKEKAPKAPKAADKEPKVKAGAESSGKPAEENAQK